MATKTSRRAKSETRTTPAKAAPRAAGRTAPAAQTGKKTSMADRRARILAVAAHRFAEHGFEATTVREIADDVNILSGSLYHHFATKDEMLHEIIRDAAMAMRDNTVRIAGAQADAEHRLIALILLDLGELTRNQEAHHILYNERKLFRRNVEFAYILKAKKDAYLAWQTVLKDGVKAKLFRPDIDLYLTIFTTLRMLNTAADAFKNEDKLAAEPVSAYGLDQVVDFYLSFILGAVRTPARASTPIPRKACENLAKFRG